MGSGGQNHGLADAELAAPRGRPADGDRDRLRREVIEPFRQLQARGVGVHVGEFGAYQLTPHDVTLRWTTDLLGRG